MPVGMSVLNLFREQATPISEAFFMGLLSGILLAALAYGKPSWRAAVSPEHAFGLGMVGGGLMLATLVGGDAPPKLLQLVFGSLALVAPTYLMVQAAIEWRRRRTAQK
jgi:ABC-type Mn2+/Zn2+ transport system permease subunit